MHKTKPQPGKAEALFCQEDLLTFIGVWKHTHNAVKGTECSASPWRVTKSRKSSPSIASSTSLKDKVTMDFAFFAINLNINKMASSSLPKIPNYPQMTFLFYKVLAVSAL